MDKTERKSEKDNSSACGSYSSWVVLNDRAGNEQRARVQSDAAHSRTRSISDLESFALCFSDSERAVSDRQSEDGSGSRIGAASGSVKVEKGMVVCIRGLRKVAWLNGELAKVIDVDERHCRIQFLRPELVSQTGDQAHFIDLKNVEPIGEQQDSKGQGLTRYVTRYIAGSSLGLFGFRGSKEKEDEVPKDETVTVDKSSIGEAAPTDQTGTVVTTAEGTTAVKELRNAAEATNSALGTEKLRKETEKTETLKVAVKTGASSATNVSSTPATADSGVADNNMIQSRNSQSRIPPAGSVAQAKSGSQTGETTTQCEAKSGLQRSNITARSKASLVKPKESVISDSIPSMSFGLPDFFSLATGLTQSSTKPDPPKPQTLNNSKRASGTKAATMTKQVPATIREETYSECAPSPEMDHAKPPSVSLDSAHYVFSPPDRDSESLRTDSTKSIGRLSNKASSLLSESRTSPNVNENFNEKIEFDITIKDLAGAKLNSAVNSGNAEPSKTENTSEKKASGDSEKTHDYPKKASKDVAKMMDTQKTDSKTSLGSDGTPASARSSQSTPSNAAAKLIEPPPQEKIPEPKHEAGVETRKSGGPSSGSGSARLSSATTAASKAVPKSARNSVPSAPRKVDSDPFASVLNAASSLFSFTSSFLDEPLQPQKAAPKGQSRKSGVAATGTVGKGTAEDANKANVAASKSSPMSATKASPVPASSPSNANNNEAVKEAKDSAEQDSKSSDKSPLSKEEAKKSEEVKKSPDADKKPTDGDEPKAGGEVKLDENTKSSNDSIGKTGRIVGLRKIPTLNGEAATILKERDPSHWEVKVKNFVAILHKKNIVCDTV